AEQGGLPRGHAHQPRLPADLRRARVRGLARAEPVPAERPALRRGGVARADDAARSAPRHGPDRGGGAQGERPRRAAREGLMRARVLATALVLAAVVRASSETAAMPSARLIARVYDSGFADAHDTYN